MAVEPIIRGWREYLAGDDEAVGWIILAANRSDQAIINITETAKSYKLISLYGITDGLAVACAFQDLAAHAPLS